MMNDIIKTKIVGSTFKENGQKNVTLLQKGQTLLLIPEPSNPADSNAISIYTEDFKELGYVKKELAETLSGYMKDGINFIAEVIEVTGGVEDKENVGCNILIKKYDITKDIMERPSLIFALENKIIAFKNKIEQLKLTLSNMYENKYYDISKMVDEDGKKIYTNDDQRKYATNKALSENIEYLAIQKELDKKSSDFEFIKNELDYNKRMHRSAMALIKLKEDKE